MEKESATTSLRPRAAGPAHAQPPRRSRSADKDGPTDEALADTAEHAIASVGVLYRQARDVLQHQMDTSPYVTLGAAAGLGFVIGGGLVSPLGQMLLRSSVRTFGPPLLQAALNAAAGRSAEPEPAKDSD